MRNLLITAISLLMFAQVANAKVQSNPLQGETFYGFQYLSPSLMNYYETCPESADCSVSGSTEVTLNFEHSCATRFVSLTSEAIKIDGEIHLFINATVAFKAMPGAIRCMGRNSETRRIVLNGMTGPVVVHSLGVDKEKALGNGEIPELPGVQPL